MTASFSVHLLDGQHHELIEAVLQLTAADASGQFGLLPHHEYFITALQPGLVRCRLADQSLQALATAGGLLRCEKNQVQIVSTRILRGTDETTLLQQLDQQLHSEQQRQQKDRQSNQNLEHSLLKGLRDWSEHQR